MSPGRASSALTICRSLLPASALRTHVCTAAQPLPSILWPDCSSDHVTKLAHHGFPGPTPAAARYSSTLAPVLTPSSWTPAASSFFAISSADAPRLLEPDAVAVAASATAAGTVPGAANALAGPTGGFTALNDSESPFLGGAVASAASLAVTARKLIESPGLGLGSATAAAAAAGAGWPGTAAAAATGAPGAAAAAATGGAAAGAVKPGGGSPSKATCR